MWRRQLGLQAGLTMPNRLLELDLADADRRQRERQLHSGSRGAQLDPGGDQHADSAPGGTLQRSADRARQERISSTNEGEMLVAHGRRMIALNDEAVADLSPQAVAGTVRIASPISTPSMSSPDLLADFSELYPQVQIQLQSGVSQQEVLQTLGGVNDLMIALEPADSTAGLVPTRERAIWATSVRHKTHLKTPR